jgi:hypothetical protein
MTDQYGTAPDVPFAPTPAPGITPTMPMLPVSPAISGVVPSTPAQDLMRRGTGLAFNQKMPIDSLIKLLPALASATNAASDIDPMQTTAGGYLDMQGNFVANQGPTLPAKQAIEQNKTNVDFAKNGPKQSERSLWNVAARKFENVKLLDTQAPPPGYVTDDQVVTVWDAWGNEKTRGQKVTITREEMLRNPDRYLDLKDKPVPYVNAQGKTVPKYPWEVTANDAANKRALDQADLNLRTRKTEADIASDKDRNNIARTQANTASAVASANIKHLQAETQQLLRAPGAAKGASGNAGRNTGRELSQKMALALDIRAKGAVEDSKGKITAWRTPNAEADYRRAMLDWRDATIAELHRQAPSVIVDGQLLKPGVEQDAWVNTRLKMMKFPENF